MNLVLIERHELDEQGCCELGDERARHLTQVLGVAIGQSIRIGIIDGPLGTAAVQALTAHNVRLLVRTESARNSRSEDSLLLAVPRPKVLHRVLEDAVTLGYGRIGLMRTWRVDKSHLQSPRLENRALCDAVRRGMAQGAHTQRPELRVFDRFRPMLEDELPQWLPPGPRYLAHPRAAEALSGQTVPGGQPFSLAIGPERGFTDYELQRFVEIGFQTVSAGNAPLRVHPAMCVLTGQLQLLRSQTGISGDKAH